MNVTRREVLESLGIAAAGIVTAGYTATAKGFAANESITVGCIGTGGRCRKLMLRKSKVTELWGALFCEWRVGCCG
jgi:hypothetical protein